jgi:hypothetical protein
VETGNALIGTLLAGTGTLLVIGAIKNRTIFGKDGLVTRAIASGDFSKLEEGSTVSRLGGTLGQRLDAFDTTVRTGAAAQSIGAVALRIPVIQASDNVRKHDAALANLMVEFANELNGQSSQQEVSNAFQLAAVLDQLGFEDEAETFRNFIETATR